MGKRILIVVLFLVASFVNAQNYKFGKISIEDITLIDTSSVATVLFKKQKTFYEYRVDEGFVLITQYEKRIKINKVEGLNYANIEVRLYDELATKKEIIGDVRGVTYNLVNGKIERTKLKNKEVFEEKYNKYWKKIKIVMPNVQKGSVVDVKYYTESPFTDRIQDVVLQERIPVKEFDYQVDIPEYFTFNLHENIKSEYKIKLLFDGKHVSKYITWKEKVNQVGGFVTKKFEKTLDYQEKVIKFNEKKIPALKKERYSGELNNYVIKLAFDLQSTKSFNGLSNSYASNWDIVTKNIYEQENFKGELDKVNYFKKDIDNLLNNSDGNSDKISSIVNFIKSRVKWNKFNGYIPDLGVKKAYKGGEGNVADINLMLVAMLRYAGFKANPILVSTKSNGEALFPTRQGFDYVICGIEISDEVLLLDATNLNSSINILPIRVLNWQGRIIREHGSSAWVNLFPSKNSVATTMLSINLNEDLTFSGGLRNQKTDYLAYNYRNKYAGIANEALIKSISKDKGEIEISNLEVKNENNILKPILQSYEFTYDDGVEEIGNEIYVDPLLFLTDVENIFNQEERKYNIDFNFPWTNKTIVNLTIPERYRIKSFPKSEKIIMIEELGEYNYLVRVNGNSIQISQVLKINTPIIPASYYEGLRGVYKKMIEKNSEKIVLEKI